MLREEQEREKKKKKKKEEDNNNIVFCSPHKVGLVTTTFVLTICKTFHPSHQLTTMHLHTLCQINYMYK